MKLIRSNTTLARKAGISAVSLALGALFIGGSMSAAAAPFAFDMAVSAAAAPPFAGNVCGLLTARQIAVIPGVSTRCTNTRPCCR